MLVRRSELNRDDVLEAFPAAVRSQVAVLDPEFALQQSGSLATELVQAEPPRLHPDDVKLIADAVRHAMMAPVLHEPVSVTEPVDDATHDRVAETKDLGQLAKARRDGMPVPQVPPR